MPAETFPPELIKRRMWLEYQYASSNPSNPLACIHDLINELADPSLELERFLQKAADTMSERLCIHEVTIGLKDPDGVFRYKVMSGLEDSEWEAHKRLSYTIDQFDNPALYEYKQISKYTRLYLAEDNPYREGEEETYSKPLMLMSSRKSLEDTIEGDYMDIYIYGKNDELSGWIEISGLKNGKFPTSETIKVVELFASVIGVLLARPPPGPAKEPAPQPAQMA